MALVDSLLTAMVRADGDALVMHVGERPYVVTARGPIDLSAQTLHLDAMTGMLAQLLPAEAQATLGEFGAVEQALPWTGEDRFSVVAARGGDDIWIEIRRRRQTAAAVTAPAAPIPEPSVEPEAVGRNFSSAAPEYVVPIPEPSIEPEVVGRNFSSAAPAHVVPTPEPSIESESASPTAPEPQLEAVEIGEPAPALVAQGAEADPASDDRIVIDLPLEEPAAPPAPIEPLPVASVESVAEPVVEPVGEPGAEPVAEAAAETAGEPQGAPVEPEPRVLPMVRTVRIEVPPRASASRVGPIERLLRVAAARGAAAVFLTTESRPYLRVEGDIRPLDDEPVLSRSDVEAATMEIGSGGRERAGAGEAAEWIAEMPEVGRIRCASFSDHRGPGLLVRLIATRAATAEQLGLAREVQALATEPEGLVIVAAPRGGGKSTLVSALVDLVNRQRAEYVVTLERQIRFVHDNRLALVSQREIRGGADEALGAARAALRESPDVLVVDDLLSAHMVPLLVEAAGQGLLVFVSTTAPSAPDAVARLVDLAPPGARTAVQAALAETFRGAVAQVLLKKSAGGRVAAREVMLGTAPVTRLLADGQFAQLPLAIESGRRHGMAPLTDALVALVRSGVVDVREAYRKCPDRERLLAGLRREGVDTAVVERLA